VSSGNPSERFVEAAGLKVEVMSGGSGRPLLVMHHDIGNQGWIPFYEELARDFTVFVPSHPGYGKSARPDWARNVRDIAIVYQSILGALGLERTAVVGLGFGGWIAAEIALGCPHRFDRMVLVGSAGIQPASGEIFDQFIVNTIDYLRAGFANPDDLEKTYGANIDAARLEAWEIAREMTTRIAWKPYMFDQAMPYLAPTISAPLMLVHGREDRIVPLSCSERYASLVPGAKLNVIDGAGHFIEAERPNELAAIVKGFVAGGR
jgi:pimeloyl-ACP methyl ester carboxylesterase